jgi:hypothetical protein
MEALRTAASFATLNHSGVAKFDASPQLNPATYKKKNLPHKLIGGSTNHNRQQSSDQITA